jgi:hypothetical protein
VRTIFPSYSTSPGGEEESRAYEFDRCLFGWEVLRADRAEVKAAMKLKAEASEGWVAVEVGNSSYVSYEFVIASGSQLRSSYGPSRDASIALQKSVESALGNAEIWHRKSNSRDIDDNCYFVTVSKNGRAETYAYYGLDPSTDVGKFLQSLIQAAQSVE